MPPASGLLATLVAEKELELECRARAQRAVQPTVVEPDGLGRLGAKMFPEGTILCFVAERGSGHLEGVQAVVESGDLAALDALSEELTAMQNEAMSSAAERSDVDAHLVDVRYGTAPLGRGIAPSLVPISVSRAIWNGGDLDLAKFAAVDHVRDITTPEVEVLVVLSRPKLTELEEATVRAVPAELDELHVKGPSLSWTPVARAGLGPKLQGEGSPLFQRIQDITHQQQVQQQQEDTRVQDQQQHQQQADHQQQAQQHQHQDQNYTQQQQQQQMQDNNQHQQHQQQQQQDAKTQQHQEQRHQDQQTRQQVQSASYRDLVDEWEGIQPHWFEREQYLQLLETNDFSTLDATQSARALLGIREQLLRFGMP